MTVAEVEHRVAAIALTAGDFEAAHALEDDLYADVLRAVASGADNGMALALAALNSKRVRFSRVCA